MTRRRSVLATSCILILAGCASSGTTVLSGPIDIATEEEWRALRTDPVEALPGAPALSVYEVRLGGAWGGPGAEHEALAIGVTELITAGLMRRADVDFVERRRFAPAAEAIRLGRTVSPRQPEPGVTRPVDYMVQATWLPIPGGEATVEVQLVDPASGEVVEGARAEVRRDADPVLVARVTVATALRLVDRRATRPSWNDPLARGAAMNANVTGSSGVSESAIRHFLDGVSAEERWNWEGARRGYVAAATDPSFHEADTLLGRAARLRLGGTLAEN